MKKKKEKNENKKKNRFILPIATVILVTILSITLAYNIKDTYSAGGVTVEFWSATTDRNFINCKTGSNGKISSDCAKIVGDICHSWATFACNNSCGRYYTGQNAANNNYFAQQGRYDSTKFYTSEVTNRTYSSNFTWFCVHNTSIHPGYTEIGCYVCKNDSNIKKWGTPNTIEKLSGEKCTGGYKVIENTLVRNNGGKDISALQNACTTTKYCYVCKANSNVMKWSTNGNGDNACSGGYNKDTKIKETNCKTKTVTNACYVCKDNANIMKWGSSAAADTACASGYNKDSNKTESQCKTINNACYVCKDNDKVMKWSTNGNADDKCSAGYNKDTTKTTKNSCAPPDSACYVCKTNSAIMKWSTDGNADNKCSAGYNKDTTKTTVSSCVPPQKACYVCKGNENIVKWSTNGNSDDKCTGGYNKTTSNEANCVANPKTGTSGIAIAWFAAIFAMTFAYYYFKESLFKATN